MTIKEPTKIAGVRYLTGIACAQHELRLQLLKLTKRIEYRFSLAHNMANEEIAVARIRCQLLPRIEEHRKVTD